MDKVQAAICRDNPGGGVQMIRVRTVLGYCSNANGHVERAVRSLKGLIRTYVCDVQIRLSSPDCNFVVKEESSLLSYIILYSSWVYNHFHVQQKSGLTPYERLTGRDYTKSVCNFLSPVL